jgi:UDP-3-O-acyl N-acetylglucosamine deacetylase
MRKQRTLRKEARFSGRGLQTGRKVSMRCLPAPADAGIVFHRTDLGGGRGISLRQMAVPEPGRRRTSLGTGPVKVQTVEHFLAALWALGIGNLTVEIDGGELPAMGGSPSGFLSELEAAGTEDQDLRERVLEITEPVTVSEGNRSVSILPYDRFSVSYLIDYDVACIGRQKFSMDLDGESFKREIAPARTFCMLREALLLRLTGLGRGATLSNTLVLSGRGPVRNRFRFPDEPVRHKVADLIGDLYVLNRPLRGRVEAVRSGHRLNAMLVNEISGRYTVQK